MTTIGRARWPMFAFSVLLGGVAALLAIRHGDMVFGLFAFALLTAFGAWLGFGRSESAVIGSDEGDERQRAINTEAAAFAWQAVAVVAVLGFFTEIARGEPGPFALVCAVGGFTHVLAIAALRRRR